MRTMKTKRLERAMHIVAMNIRMDLVLHVAFVKEGAGGHFYLWVTQAGDHKTIEWELKFIEGTVNVIELPKHLTEEQGP